MPDYRKLSVWQKAHDLTLATCATGAHLRHPEASAVRDQAFRAAISIASNIAEGAGRGSDRDFRRFCLYSLGSCNELEYDLLLARDLSFLPPALHSQLAGQIEEVRRMLTGLIQTLAT